MEVVAQICKILLILKIQILTMEKQSTINLILTQGN